LAENDAQSEWALPDGRARNREASFRASGRSAATEASREISPHSPKRFLDFAPLRSAPLGMTGWGMGKEWTLAENDKQGEWTLPDGWEIVPVRDVFEVHYGKGLVKSKRDESGKVPVYGSSGVVGYHIEALVDGPCIIVGRKGAVGQVYHSKVPCWPIDTTYYIQPPKGFSLEYVSYVLDFMKLGALDKSTAIPGLNRDDFYSQVVPIPPSSEQRRIVAGIETQFKRLDAAVVGLERAQANIRRYKAAVLQAACEGRLVPTEAELARAEGRNYEPADQLLARILAERRARWEADYLEKQRAKGREPKDDKWKQKYKEPAPPDREELPELPEGWAWTTMAQTGSVIGGLTKNSKRKDYPLQLPYLRVANVYADELRLDDVREIGVRETELERVLLKKGDLLVVEGNGSIEQIGRVALWNGSIEPCVHQNHIIKVRFTYVELGKYILLWLLSTSGREHITRVASSTSGLYTLSLSKVSSIPIPLPPLTEQRRIVAEVERRLSLVAALEASVEAALARAGRLRQAVLKQAFEGRLVPQDPDDEPASVLLERIKAERTQRRAEGKRTGDSKKPKAEDPQQLRMF
jgi:type I restriction enzyme S subunit